MGTEEESSDRHSSEEDVEGDGEVWTITEEQREYYRAQFRSLQPDPTGLIAGPAARQFFEKSRLPVQELRKIWYCITLHCIIIFSAALYFVCVNIQCNFSTQFLNLKLWLSLFCHVK